MRWAFLRGGMFPDFRLMIAAVLGSVVALMCGFGVFAAFRVNHEPLARLPSGHRAVAIGRRHRDAAAVGDRGGATDRARYDRCAGPQRWRRRSRQRRRRPLLCRSRKLPLLNPNRRRLRRHSRKRPPPNPNRPRLKRRSAA